MHFVNALISRKLDVIYGHKLCACFPNVFFVKAKGLSRSREQKKNTRCAEHTLHYCYRYTWLSWLRQGVSFSQVGQSQVLLLQLHMVVMVAARSELQPSCSVTGITVTATHGCNGYGKE
jgi:hypothetical protein